MDGNEKSESTTCVILGDGDEAEAKARREVGPNDGTF